MKSIIVGVARRNAIGADHDMPWHKDVPADLAYFARMTKGNSVIVGRNTFDHDFRGKPLPERETIVVSSQPVGVKGVLTASSLEAAYELARYPVFVSGGGRVYAEAINDMDRLYVTHIDADFPNATVHFPAIDPDVWKETSREHHEADERNKYAYDFVVYDRQ
jgi:dihydrofolate reductase